MDSHASIAESANHGEEVDKNADSPRELDCRPEARHTAIAAVYSSEHSSSGPANGVGGRASFKLRDPGAFGLLTSASGSEKDFELSFRTRRLTRCANEGGGFYL